MRRFEGRTALVTGGLGFIGSNVARTLRREGAKVVVIDAALEGSGANYHNLDGERDIRLIHCDIGSPAEFHDAISTSDYIFNLAGEISHIDSMRFPERDLERNTISQLRFLESCRRWRPGVRIVYASTRQLYGIPQYLPVDEKHPIHPVDYNGIHKFAATQYHLMLTHAGELDAAVLRLTNVYGPRMSLTAPNQGFLGVFLRRLLRGESLSVYGDGSQLRDPLYIDDAVEAFLLLALKEKLSERTFNAGGPEVLSMSAIAEESSRRAGVAPPRKTPFPPERKAIDIGSYYSDSRLLRESTGWRPVTRFSEAFAATLDFYRPRLDRYLEQPAMALVP